VKLLIADLNNTFTNKRNPIMTISYKEVLQTLSPEQRQTVETRAAELIAEEMTLRDLRKARSLTQEKMAELLQIRQENVSRIEHRTDLLLSTLREYIEAMGGELDLVVKFHGRPPIKITTLAEETTLP
jgi:DNA-binding XRE family transcriptional regulator